MKCEKCGTELKTYEKFCTSCGEKTKYADMPFGSVTITRNNSYFGCIIPFKIYIDGELKAEIKVGQTCTFELPFGTHEIILNSLKDKKQRTTIELKEDKKEYNIKIGVNMFALSFVAKGKIKSVD